MSRRGGLELRRISRCPWPPPEMTAVERRTVSNLGAEAVRIGATSRRSPAISFQFADRNSARRRHVMALAALIAITTGCIAWSLWIRRVTWSCRWEVAATLNIALQGAAILVDVTAGVGDRRALAALADRHVESRGLHRPRLLHRGRVRDRLQRAGPPAGRPRDAGHVQAVHRASGHPLHPAATGRVLPRQRRERSTVRTSSTCPPTSGSAPTGWSSAAPSSTCWGTGHALCWYCVRIRGPA